jgi:hypothetical protein
MRFADAKRGKTPALSWKEFMELRDSKLTPKAVGAYSGRPYGEVELLLDRG